MPKYNTFWHCSYEFWHDERSCSFSPVYSVQLVKFLFVWDLSKLIVINISHRSIIGCGAAQIVVRRPAVRQALVRIPARQMEIPLLSESDEEIWSGISECDDLWMIVLLYVLK